MTPWIQVYTNAPTHRKTYRLAEELRVPIYAALGLMVSLWAWAAVNATGGDITGYPPMAICDAVGWKKGVKFYNALKKVRLIEEVDGKILIRNWERYAQLLMDYADNQREKTKERVRKYRERKKNHRKDFAQGSAQGGNVSGNATVTLPSVTVTPLPNLTLPNQYSTTGVSSKDTAYIAPEEAATAAEGEENKLRYLQGKLGKGVVLLSDKQMQQLLDKMGLDCFEYYTDRLSSFIIDKQAKVSNHYETILRWWQEDLSGRGGGVSAPGQNWGRKPVGKRFIQPGQELSELEKQAVAMALAGMEEDETCLQ